VPTYYAGRLCPSPAVAARARANSNECKSDSYPRYVQPLGRGARATSFVEIGPTGHTARTEVTYAPRGRPLARLHAPAAALPHARRLPLALCSPHTPESAVAPAPLGGSRAVSTHRILEHVEGVCAGTKESIIAVCRAARAEIARPRERVPREASYAREGSRARATVSTAREGDTGDRGGTTTTSVVALAPMAPPTDPPLVTTGPTVSLKEVPLPSALVHGWRSSCVPNGPPWVARLPSRRIRVRDASDRQPARA